MKHIVDPPPLDQQWNEIVSLCIYLDKDNKDMEQLPHSRPKCESIVGPAKYGPLAFTKTDIAIAMPYMNWRGENTPNARKCPHCHCLHFDHLPLGTLKNCNNCHQDMCW